MQLTGQPYQECREIQKKIKEKHERITRIKGLLDNVSEDIQRQDLNEEISKNLNELQELKNKFNEIISSEQMFEKVGQEKLTIVISEELTELVELIHRRAERGRAYLVISHREELAAAVHRHLRVTRGRLEEC